jgi:hypothetical protein
LLRIHPFNHTGSCADPRLPSLQFFNAAFGTQNVSWDPYKNDINFVLSMFALEEVGATGDQGVTSERRGGLSEGVGVRGVCQRLGRSVNIH